MSKFKEELKKLKPLNFLLLTLSGTINASCSFSPP